MGYIVLLSGVVVFDVLCDMLYGVCVCVCLYRYLKRIFRKLFARRGFKDDGVFDWDIRKKQREEAAVAAAALNKVKVKVESIDVDLVEIADEEVVVEVEKCSVCPLSIPLPLSPSPAVASVGVDPAERSSFPPCPSPCGQCPCCYYYTHCTSVDMHTNASVMFV